MSEPEDYCACVRPDPMEFTLDEDGVTGRHDKARGGCGLPVLRVTDGLRMIQQSTVVERRECRDGHGNLTPGPALSASATTQAAPVATLSERARVTLLEKAKALMPSELGRVVCSGCQQGYRPGSWCATCGPGVQADVVLDLAILAVEVAEALPALRAATPRGDSPGSYYAHSILDAIAAQLEAE